MINFTQKLNLLSLIFLSIFFANAEAAGQVDVIGVIGLNGGGDTLMTVKDDEADEEDNEKWNSELLDIRAGSYLTLKLGMVYSPSNDSPKSQDIDFQKWEIQTTLGWEVNNIDNRRVGSNYNIDEGSTSHARFSSYPIDIIGFRKFHILRIGAGVSYHLNPKLEGNKLPVGLDGNFDNALGIIFEIDCLIRNLFLVGLTYEIVEYQSSSDTFSGNSLGAFAGIRF